MRIAYANEFWFRLGMNAIENKFVNWILTTKNAIDTEKIEKKVAYKQTNGTSWMTNEENELKRINKNINENKIAYNLLPGLKFIENIIIISCCWCWTENRNESFIYCMFHDDES